MNKRNKVKHLNKMHAHRKAMLNNMVTSLFYHENIRTTVAKAKVARQLAEKLITRARENVSDKLNAAQKLHNLRLAGRIVKDEEVLQKLFNDIAPRFTTRPGGYTRILKVGQRISDASEMAILELVQKKPLALLKDERKATRAEHSGADKPKKTGPTKEEKAAKKAVKVKEAKDLRQKKKEIKKTKVRKKEKSKKVTKKKK